MSAYTVVTYRGRTLNRRTIAMIEEAEKRLGYQLTILQGSYNAGGVAASAGTHDGGGAVDVWGKSLAEAEIVVRVLRGVGFAAWLRTPSQGPWGYHIHAIAIGDRDLSTGAANQVADYRAGRNGLANHAPDNDWRPNPIPVFAYNILHALRIRNQFTAVKPHSVPGVKAVQNALVRNGYKVVVDGVAGPQTRRAFMKWSKGSLPNRKNLQRLVRGRFRVEK